MGCLPCFDIRPSHLHSTKTQEFVPFCHWRSISTAKCVLSGAKGRAQEACGIDQLRGGLQAGIEGDVHAMHSLWETHKMEEEWGILLIDANNYSIEINSTVIRHEWQSGASFCFNC